MTDHLCHDAARPSQLRATRFPVGSLHQLSREEEC